MNLTNELIRRIVLTSLSLVRTMSSKLKISRKSIGQACSSNSECLLGLYCDNTCKSYCSNNVKDYVNNALNTANEIGIDTPNEVEIADEEESSEIKNSNGIP